MKSASRMLKRSPRSRRTSSSDVAFEYAMAVSGSTSPENRERFAVCVSIFRESSTCQGRRKPKVDIATEICAEVQRQHHSNDLEQCKVGLVRKTTSELKQELQRLPYDTKEQEKLQKSKIAFYAHALGVDIRRSSGRRRIYKSKPKIKNKP